MRPEICSIPVKKLCLSDFRLIFAKEVRGATATQAPLFKFILPGQRISTLILSRQKFSNLNLLHSEVCRSCETYQQDVSCI